MSERTIFLIEEDRDAQLLFNKILKDKGYKVILTVNEADALDKVSNGFGKIDVVLVDLVKKPTAEMLKTGQRIREKERLNVPVVVIAAEYKDELQGTSEKVGENEYVVYLEDTEELFDLLSRLT